MIIIILKVVINYDVVRSGFMKKYDVKLKNNRKKIDAELKLSKDFLSIETETEEIELYFNAIESISLNENSELIIDTIEDNYVIISDDNEAIYDQISDKLDNNEQSLEEEKKVVEEVKRTDDQILEDKKNPLIKSINYF